jgi:hypothetical protein
MKTHPVVKNPGKQQFSSYVRGGRRTGFPKNPPHAPSTEVSVLHISQDFSHYSVPRNVLISASVELRKCRNFPMVGSVAQVNPPFTHGKDHLS